METPTQYPRSKTIYCQSCIIGNRLNRFGNPLPVTLQYIELVLDRREIFPELFSSVCHRLLEGCNIPVGWAVHSGWITVQASPADLPSSESTAAGFAFNIPVRAVWWKYSIR